MDDNKAVEIARELFADHQAGRAFRPLPDDIAKLPAEHAYQVQRRFNTLQVKAGIGEPLGYKIALTSAAMQEFVGVSEPLAGVLYSSRIQPGPATCKISDFQHVGVEFEVTVRMGADLPASARPHTRESVASAIATCAPSYELVEDRNADFNDINVFNLIAENCWNAGLIIGHERTDWRDVDLENGGTHLWIDGKPAGDGRTGDALGHPLEVVAWLANLLNDQGTLLERDMLVMTGSSITTRFPDRPCHYRFEVDGLGAVEIDWES